MRERRARDGEKKRQRVVEQRKKQTQRKKASRLLCQIAVDVLCALWEFCNDVAWVAAKESERRHNSVWRQHRVVGDAAAVLDDAASSLLCGGREKMSKE